MGILKILYTTFCLLKRPFTAQGDKKGAVSRSFSVWFLQLLLELGALAHAVTQEVELGPADLALAH